MTDRNLTLSFCLPISTFYRPLSPFPFLIFAQTKNKLRGYSPQSELYRPSDRRLSAKLVRILADRGCRVVRATNPHGR
jgi:hypothetical protein